MLKERISYKQNLPISVKTIHIDNYPIHFHDDIEVVYVLGGKVTLRNGYCTYTLSQGDVYIINDREMHSFEGSFEENMVMLLHMDLNYFGKYYDRLKNSFFVTDEDEGINENMGMLRDILVKIMLEFIRKGYRYEEKVIECAHNLIGNLLLNFNHFVMDNGRFKNQGNLLDGKRSKREISERLNRITNYMYEHYNRKLMLKEVAENEYLSIYYLSHIIKDSTGLCFQDLLNYIRVEESEKVLLGTKKSIGRIAEEMGFSAVRYYVKHFTKWFGLHPAEYRKECENKIYCRELNATFNMHDPADIEKAVSAQANGIYTEYAEKEKNAPVIIDVDPNETISDRQVSDTTIGTIMDRPINMILAKPYKRLKSIGERLIHAGENYLITSSGSHNGMMDSLSVLVYNFDEEVTGALKGISNHRDLLKIVKSYRNEGEFLIRSKGFTGEYKIIRWRLDQNSLAGRIEKALARDENADERETLIQELATNSRVHFETVKCSEVLSIRSVFNGIGAELILVDSI